MSIGSSSSASVEDSASSNRSSVHRRSRSLSRFSHRLQTPASDDFDETPAPRGKFVNTVRGSGFPEISLDDLAVEFFDSGDRGRSASRKSEVTPVSGSSVSQRRGSALSRRRRSVSVVRYQISDSESDLDHSQKRNNANPKSLGSGNEQLRSSHKPKASNQRQGLRRSFSQKDLRSCDGYSSQSSVLTDDEGRDAHSGKNGIERTIRTVYAQKKAQHPTGDDVNGSIYEAMRTELRHAVKEIRTEFEQAMGKTKPTASAPGDCLLSNSSDVLQAVSSIRWNYSTQLEESEKRKQDLLSEIVLEEQRSRELSKIVKELIPEPKISAVVDKPSRAGTRRRSTDKGRMSKRLSEEAEKYIEDFISNIEDTDISSLDGERSDTSSSIGGGISIAKTRISQNPAMSTPLPIDSDGVILPWLKWETSNDASPILGMNKMESPITPNNTSFKTVQEVSNEQDPPSQSASSRGSWSPAIMDSLPMKVVEGNGNCRRSSYPDGSKTNQFDMEDYLKLQRDEDLLFERFRQQHRVNSGGMFICNRIDDLSTWLPITSSRYGKWLVFGLEQLMVEVGVNIVYMITGGNCKPIKTTFFMIMMFGSIHFILSHHLPNFNSITIISLIAAVTSLIELLNLVSLSRQRSRPRCHLCSTTRLGDVAFAFAGHNVVLEIQETIPSTPDKPSKKPMCKGVLVIGFSVIAWMTTSLSLWRNLGDLFSWPTFKVSWVMLGSESWVALGPMGFGFWVA
uniref:Amino acid transporter transmembrane domain-containing protein n=1 Tax=Cannabis sativa TaxID=3483 RepID=A0A803P8F0_CANSA